MLAYLIILFTVVPAVELAILIKVGQHIGVMNTLTVIVLTGVVGAYLARLQGFLLIQKVQNNLNRGIMPSEEMLDGFLILLGGIVLLTPGFVTDATGLILLLPFCRNLIKKWLKHKMTQMINEGNTAKVNTSSQKSTKSDDHFEDAQFY